MAHTFDGHWKVDIAQSRIWDYQNGGYIPDPVGAELIRIRIDGDVQDYEVLLGEQPTIRMGYTSRYDDAQWVPYTVREIRGISNEPSDQVLADFVKRTHQRAKSFSVGDVYGLVRVIYVDDRTHYRVSKDAKGGLAEYVMLRRLAEDGQSYTSSVLRVDGIVSTIRRFTRVPG
jgi:hypothetical protein